VVVSIIQHPIYHHTFIDHSPAFLLLNRRIFIS
jgi:hypothetical protein